MSYIDSAIQENWQTDTWLMLTPHWLIFLCLQEFRFGDARHFDENQWGAGNSV